jgi:hypothetical protein
MSSHSLAGKIALPANAIRVEIEIDRVSDGCLPASLFL